MNTYSTHVWGIRPARSFVFSSIPRFSLEPNAKCRLPPHNQPNILFDTASTYSNNGVAERSPVSVTIERRTAGWKAAMRKL